MDSRDFQILVALHRDARQSYQSIGRRVGLSAPAVRERLKRLERRGVLHGYGLWIDPAEFGREEVLAFFSRERTVEQVSATLMVPDVAWVGWKLEGGLTVGLWTLDAGRSVERLAAALGEQPTGQTTTLQRGHAPLQRLDWMVLDALIDDPRVAFGDLAKSTGLSPKTVRKHLMRVFESGVAMIMPRQGSAEGSGELVYHLALGGDLTESQIRKVIPDAVFLHQTERPPMRYVLCRSSDLSEVTAAVKELRRLPDVTSAAVTLNRDLLFSAEFEHSLVREKMAVRAQ